MKTKILSLLFGAMFTCYVIYSNAQNVWHDASNGTSITTGTDNSAFGHDSQNKNKTGNRNTSFGYKSLFSTSSGSNNTALGATALLYNTTGSYNTATGHYSLYNSISANNNTANGAFSLYFHKKGNENSAFGAYALYNDTVSNFNTASGFSSLYNNRSGSYNTATGCNSMYFNFTGTRNTAIGTNSLYGNNGSYNAAFGMNAIYHNTSGSNNTALGYYADVSTFDLENATATANNQVMLGNSSVTAVKTYGDIIWTSDSRFKKNVKENVPGLDFIKQLRPVTYNFDIHKLDAHTKATQEKGNPENDLSPDAWQKDEEAISKKEKKLYSGFLAQEVEATANKLGYDFNGIYHPQNDKDVYGLGYADFVVPLVKAVQELSKENDGLKERIEKLEAMMSVQPQTSSQSAKSVSVTNATLEQNIPNPFNNTTTISYTLPQKFTTAQILITDANGKVLKQANVSGTGKGTLNVNASLLSSGAYNYALIIDGKMIAGKKMVVAK